jgi:Ca-activated chloride channel family protein
MQQLKQALNQFLELLTPDDRFNLITFGTHVTKFQPDLVSASFDQVYAAQAFVQQMYALGMTNIDGALRAALTQSFGTQSSNNLIFLTDGLPTYGETRIDVLVDSANSMNKKDVRIFSFGVGETLSKPFYKETQIRFFADDLKAKMIWASFF